MKDETENRNRNRTITLPDGSAFAVVSFPLPGDHWIYEEREKDPPPMLFRMGKSLERVYWDNKIRKAAKYAIRASTINGKEMDFDPDAMVQNMVIGMLGYYTEDGAGDEDWQNPDEIPNSPINPREAIFAFASWLTCRNEPVTASRKHNAAIWAELADKFCDANGFHAIKTGWEKNIKHPKE